jgi:plastocyanin
MRRRSPDPQTFEVIRMPTPSKQFLAIAGFAMTLLASTSSAVFAEQPNAVTIKNFDFSPMSLTVKAGTTVTWKNLDGEPHTITSVDGLFRSGALDSDETYSFRFDKPGTYKYVCSIHPRMTASIVVK